MQRELIGAIARIRSQQRRMHIRRVMWLDLEERVRQVHDSVDKTLSAIDAPVRIYLSVNPTNLEVCKGRPAPSRVLITNTIYLVASSIHYPVTKIFGGNAPEHVFDSGAQLWFSQSPSGGVTVFMSPFHSALHKVKEKELWVASYEEPAQLTERKLRKHLLVFARYLTETNMAAPPSFIGYLFRLRMMLVDGRNRSELLRFTAKLFASFVIPIVAIVVGAAVTLATAK
jgi:hypothetical protein